jgi:FkbM family methyltransferase
MSKIKQSVRNFVDNHPRINNLFRKFYNPKFYFEGEIFQDKPVNFYRTSTGCYYLPVDAINDEIANYIKSNLFFEPEIVEIAKEYIDQGSTVLDIGANFGQMSLLFSQVVGADGQVFSFEADDYVYQILIKNIYANKCANIRPFLGEVYNITGKDIIYHPLDFKGFRSYASQGLGSNAVRGKIVKSIAIDDLNIRDCISFMKVDIQASNLFALHGAVETIKKHKMPIVFEFEQQSHKEFQTSFQDYVDFADSISYRFERTIYKTNYLIVPNNNKIFAVSQFQSSPEKNILKSQVVNSEIISPYPTGLCKMLKTKSECNECTSFLYSNGFKSCSTQAKDWDLAHILPHIKDGNFLDMGSCGSVILENLSMNRFQGELYGVDLREPYIPCKNVKYVIGDLMDTKLPSGFFKNITCLSVIEHEVNFAKFANEASRLLEKHGRLFVTFDYWNPKLNPRIKLFGLNWQPLDQRSCSGINFRM